ncbi:MAG: RES domain-containing protein [Gemmatimonadota bacterium]
MPVAETLWRVFPWDAAARAGDKFSPQFLPSLSIQGSGRFDVAAAGAAALYLAETPEHAVAELIQGFRGGVLEPDDLTRYGKPLALVSIVLREERRDDLVDLCTAASLVNENIAPDETAARGRAKTQGIAGRLLAAGYLGLRWWSAFFGEWHTLVLFTDRLRRADLEFGTPELLNLRHPQVLEAARAIDVALGPA